MSMHRNTSSRATSRSSSGCATCMTEMGGIVENQVAMAAEADHEPRCRRRNPRRGAGPEVDALEREVEQFVIRMLALRQPMAGDLRQIVAALKITGDLERIGDYAANVAKRSIVLDQFTAARTASAASRTWRGWCRRTSSRSSTRWARVTPTRRSRSGARTRRSTISTTRIFRELITYMMEDPRNITPCTHLLFIAKNLERIGDHATNIAETVHYAVKGETLPETRPKGDTSAYAVVRPSSERRGR